ncbi:MAG: PilZ domain-containing protein [Spirochaetales bacterium]|nr:PilZ domain-containing protein [Spirochaetales bacterium]
MKEDLARQFPRISSSCDVEFHINHNSFNDYQGINPEITIENNKSRAKDISLGGICIITYLPLPQNINIDLHFKLRDTGQEIKAVGKVMWTESFSIASSKGYDNGIRFVEMTEGDKAILKDYIDRHHV